MNSPITFLFDTGNIRVYCRIKPEEKEKESFIQQIGETDLVAANPSKQGKEAIKTFKFNKVFGPTSTQGLFLCHHHFIIIN